MRITFSEDWQGFLRSLATYTRIPFNIDWDSTQKHTPSVCFLPFVGVVVALLSSWPLLIGHWSGGFQALLMMLSAVLLTGAFHEDGLMDACDGLVGGWTPEQRLNIMKDSRVGSYGVLAGVFSFALKWWLLSQWLTEALWNGSQWSVLAGWVVMHMTARWMPLVLMQGLPYISLGPSKAQQMIQGMNARACFWWLGSLLAVWGMVGSAILTELVLALLVLGLAIGFYLKRRLGGYNGDTLGASEQISELLVLFVLLGWSA